MNTGPLTSRHLGAGIAGLALGGLLLVISPSGCAPANRTQTIAGRTMGTTYSIHIAAAAMTQSRLESLHEKVDAVLTEISRQMSTYQPDSEISRFNRSRSSASATVSPDFAHVVRRALELTAATDGAFDPTIGPLVNLWGFGPDGPRDPPPSRAQIAEVRQAMGCRHLSISADGRLGKAIPTLEIDLSAVAKGFGVDKVAALLREKGVRNFVVEIGGETVADGVNAEGHPWRVGVLKPDRAGTALEGVAHLTGGRAIATSGDYRNFFRDKDGTVYAHIIDPRTAAPVQNGVASVSVLAGDCLTADGLATALVVLGPEDGMRVLKARFPGVEALFLLRRGAGRFEAVATPGFAAVYAHDGKRPSGRRDRGAHGRRDPARQPPAKPAFLSVYPCPDSGISRPMSMALIEWVRAPMEMKSMPVAATPPTRRGSVCRPCSRRSASVRVADCTGTRSGTTSSCAA